jgi:putative hydrolase of the HAD superfamily
MKLVIFDLDNTLVNFAATREAAYTGMSALLVEEGIDAAAYLRVCGELDRPLFKQFEQGTLTRQQYRMRRFSEPLRRLGLAENFDLVRRLNAIFMECVNDKPLLYDDVLPVLHALRAGGIHTAILTNGPSDGQRRKLHATGLLESVDQIAIGEEIGVSKPLPGAFHAVVARFSLPAGDALMVGDSPELDYDGALQAGLQARLLDRHGEHAHGPRRAIRTLTALIDGDA